MKGYLENKLEERSKSGTAYPGHRGARSFFQCRNTASIGENDPRDFLILKARRKITENRSSVWPSAFCTNSRAEVIQLAGIVNRRRKSRGKIGRESRRNERNSPSSDQSRCIIRVNGLREFYCRPPVFSGRI